MNGSRRVAWGAITAALCLILGNSLSAQAPAASQDAGVSKAPQYTMAEYNSYQACAAEKAPAAQVKCLDDFVLKYPNSTLLNYVYLLYSQSYGQLKNYPKVIENADKLAALGDKIDTGVRFNAYYTHCAAYSALITDPATAPTAVKDVALAKSAQNAAATALKTLDDVKKPENVAEDAWAKQTMQFRAFLNGVSAQAATVTKDCSGAVNAYKAVLALNPDDAVSSYRLGLAYMCLNPPQQMDAFWSIARAVTAKGELASSSAERPGSYKLASSAELTAAQKDMTIASVITDLKAGGDKAKLTWFASCGLEFPEVPGKVIEVVPGTDAVVLKIAFVTSDAEFDAATKPNMEVKVVGQPAAGRVEKDSAIHFTGALTSYDPEPSFFLHWDKAKVKEEDLPKEKAAPRKPVRRPATKKPVAKPN